jgi:hypothetical protein
MTATPLWFSYPSTQSKVSRNTTYVIHQNVGQLHVSILHIMMIRVFPRSAPLPPPANPNGLTATSGWRLVEASRSHSDTPHHNDQPVVETSTWKHITLTTNTHASAGMKTRNPSKRAAANLRLRQRGLRDRRWSVYRIETCSCLALRYIIKLCLNWPWTVMNGKRVKPIKDIKSSPIETWVDNDVNKLHIKFNCISMT